MFRRLLTRRLAHSRAQEAEIIDQFHRLYYEAAPHQTWQNTFWMGHRILKCPTDLWQYQEIFHEVRPDLVIETGTCYGGSALYMAHLCDVLGQGRVITVDLQPREGRPSHPRITYVTGSSVDPAIVAALRSAAAHAARVVVILDSDHSQGHVAAELAALADFVTPGSYLVVEDTNVNGHPVDPAHGPGPMEAVDEFLSSRPEFAIDPRGDKFFMTFNPRGYLKRLT